MVTEFVLVKRDLIRRDMCQRNSWIVILYMGFIFSKKWFMNPSHNAIFEFREVKTDDLKEKE